MSDAKILTDQEVDNRLEISTHEGWTLRGAQVRAQIRDAFKALRAEVERLKSKEEVNRRLLVGELEAEQQKTATLTARVEALETKCALLSASLRQADERGEELTKARKKDAPHNFVHRAMFDEVSEKLAKAEKGRANLEGNFMALHQSLDAERARSTGLVEALRGAVIDFERISSGVLAPQMAAAQSAYAYRKELAAYESSKSNPGMPKERGEPARVATGDSVGRQAGTTGVAESSTAGSVAKQVRVLPQGPSSTAPSAVPCKDCGTPGCKLEHIPPFVEPSAEGRECVCHESADAYRRCGIKAHRERCVSCAGDGYVSCPDHTDCRARMCQACHGTGQRAGEEK